MPASAIGRLRGHSQKRLGDAAVFVIIRQIPLGDKAQSIRSHTQNPSVSFTRITWMRP